MKTYRKPRLGQFRHLLVMILEDHRQILQLLDESQVLLLELQQVSTLISDLGSADGFLQPNGNAALGGLVLLRRHCRCFLYSRQPWCKVTVVFRCQLNNGAEQYSVRVMTAHDSRMNESIQLTALTHADHAHRVKKGRKKRTCIQRHTYQYVLYSTTIVQSYYYH